jgi:hypothetical protein
MAAPLYKPPTRVSSTQMPYLALVTSADPDWARLKRREIEYDFQRRNFFGDPTVRGANNNHSGVFPVGQPFGADDSLVLAAKAPTVGCPTPGLYQGTADGKGWA